MKKIVVVLFILVVVLVGVNEKKKLLIPDDSIRFRVIANSNSEYDQNNKLKIKDEVQNEIYKLINGAKSTNEVRNIINNNLDVIDKIVKKYNVSYDINYGDNYFPEKEYKNITYDEGEYESLVITLGDGIGDNWWCVLFPPLCLLDDNLDNLEYEFYATKLINNFK